jgi:hypothetical protein
MMKITENAVAKFIVTDWVDKVDSGIGLAYWPASLQKVGWQAGTTTTCWSQLYSSFRGYEFGYATFENDKLTFLKALMLFTILAFYTDKIYKKRGQIEKGRRSCTYFAHLLTRYIHLLMRMVWKGTGLITVSYIEFLNSLIPNCLQKPKSI